MMRRFNSYLTVGIIVLFIIHLIWGALILFGLTQGGSRVFSVSSRVLFTLIAIHAVIGVILTVRTLIAERKAHVSYPKLNRLFWIRRLSGFAMLIFAMAHVVIFLGIRTDGIYRLKPFGVSELISQLLLVLTLIIHIGVNIRPLKIALGIEDKGNIKTDVLVVVTVLLSLAAVAFLIYFMRWQRV